MEMLHHCNVIKMILLNKLIKKGFLDIICCIIYMKSSKNEFK